MDVADWLGVADWVCMANWVGVGITYIKRYRIGILNIKKHAVSTRVTRKV